MSFRRSFKAPLEPLGRERVYQAAIRLLARREHSRLELFDKLSERTQDHDMLDQVLDQLIDLNYQCDRRFCGSYLRDCISRGLGPQRIKRELKMKGINADQFEDALSEEAPDWFSLAHEVGLRKQRSYDLLEFDGRQKLTRHLVQKGFSFEQARYALETMTVDKTFY